MGTSSALKQLRERVSKLETAINQKFETMVMIFTTVDSSRDAPDPPPKSEVFKLESAWPKMTWLRADGETHDAFVERAAGEAQKLGIGFIQGRSVRCDSFPANAPENAGD